MTHRIAHNAPMRIPIEMHLVEIEAHRRVAEAAVDLARLLSAEARDLKLENAQLRDELAALKGE